MVRPPDPPKNVTASKLRTTAVTIDWDFGVSNGGDAYDNFQVSWWEGSTATGTRHWSSTHNRDLSLTISGLDCGQTYTFKVTGHNSAGWSDYSGGIVVTLPGGAWIRTTVIEMVGTGTLQHPSPTAVWRQAICYVRNGGKWKEATPYFRDGGTWKQSRR